MGHPSHWETASGRMSIKVTLRKSGTSQILFLATNHPWVAEAKAKLPMQAMAKISSPWGQPVDALQDQVAVEDEHKGRIAVRMSYMNP